MDVRVVLSGSGMLYPVFIGALKRLEKSGYNIIEIAGVSGGALVAAAYAATKSIDKLQRIAESINPHDLLDRAYDPMVAGLGAMNWPFNTDGLYFGNKLLAKFREFLPNRMGQVKIPLHVVTFNQNMGRHVIWSSRELQSIQESVCYPEMDLPKLVRASMSLPLIFSPVELPSLPKDRNAKKDLKTYLHVDGGLGSNFPLGIFGDGEDVIGLRFRPQTKPREVKNKVDEIYACIDGMLETMSRMHVAEALHARQIYLDTTGSGLDFNINKAQVDLLIGEGEASADAWLVSH